MITLHNAVCGYAGIPVLSGVSLSVQPGEMVGLLGPNGSGKTTLLLTLSGVLPPLAGEMRIHGNDCAAMPPAVRARHLASVPQRMGEPPDMEAFSLVLMGRYPHISFLGGYTEQDRRIALAAMEETGTAHLAHRSACTLSGGEFQRVLIARALAQQTECLLLDEATSGLDIARKVEIFDLLRQRTGHDMHNNGNGQTLHDRQNGHADRDGQTKQRVAVIAAIHDLNLAALYCHRLVLLKNGRVVRDGGVNEVFTQAILSEVYETRIHIVPHPVTGAPQACLVPGRTGKAGLPVAADMADATDTQNAARSLDPAPVPMAAGTGGKTHA
ncbi:ABC transporter ATP-binding protein [Desulfovibrio psychrotolerans]|uniref:Iron ABC transporter ATP-binding protein n=1 Tax=Desulfovibrio psychrotolerans TaxID=415242 RepID=A0A7J0BUV0_9BACT|nr:ABC transporter ATP-binding protein [Desulfovibrio psychrotolerans]GFM36794.1 iron ABC transporter ATP-binding protein [Desulfovibrio psychrotolerans]